MDSVFLARHSRDSVSTGSQRVIEWEWSGAGSNACKLSSGGETTKRFVGIPKMRFTSSLSGTAGAEGRREWRQSQRLTQYGRAAGSARRVECAAQHDGDARNSEPSIPTRASWHGEPRVEYTLRRGLAGFPGWTLNCQQRLTNLGETTWRVSGRLRDDQQPMNFGENQRCRETGEHEPRDSSVSGSLKLSQRASHSLNSRSCWLSSRVDPPPTPSTS